MIAIKYPLSYRVMRTLYLFTYEKKAVFLLSKALPGWFTRHRPLSQMRKRGSERIDVLPYVAGHPKGRQELSPELRRPTLAAPNAPLHSVISELSGCGLKPIKNG